MRLPGTRRSRLIVLLSLVALATSVGFWLFLRARALYRNLGPMVVAELQRQLGREVAIGRMDVHRLGRVVLDDVAVAAQKRLALGAMLRAKRITIRYSWLDILWFRTDIVGSIGRIDVDDPFLLLVRDPAGRWNVQQLFKPKPGARPTRFRAQVVVNRGRLLFQDYRAALPRLPAVNEVRNVAGNVDFRPYPQISAQATGFGLRRAGLIQATTFIGANDGRLLVRASAADVEAAYWSGYLFRLPGVQVRRGHGSVDLVVSRSEGKAPLDYVVNLAAAGLEAKVRRLTPPLREGRGFAQITPFGVKLDLSASLAEMPVQVSGNVLDWKHPQVAVSASASGLALASLRRVLPQLPKVPGLSITTPGQVQAWVLGPATRLYATGTLLVPAAVLREEPIRDLRVAWRYHAGMVQVDQVSARAAHGGRLTATGWAQVQPGPAHIYATGRLEGVNLAGLPGVSPRLKLRGQGNVQFAVSGTPQDLHGGAFLQVAGLTLNTARFNTAVARLDYQDGFLYVRSLQAKAPLGTLVAAGTVARHGNMDLQVRAKGVDVAALLAPFTRQPASGTAYFAGTVGGSVREPRLSGNLQLYAGRVGPVSMDYAEGRIALTPDRLETDGLVLRLYPGEVTVRGTAGGWRENRTRLDLQAQVSGVSVARVLAMANVRSRVAGTLSGSVVLRGAPNLPVATGSVQVDDLLVEGTRLGTATARLETDGRQLRVRQASIEGDSLAAVAQGVIGLAPSPERPQVRLLSKASPLDLTFAVQKLDLARAATRLGAGVLLEGIARVTDGVARGRLGAPLVTARAEAAPIVINGVRFARLSGQGSYTTGQVSLRDLELRENSGAVRVMTASLRPEPGKPLHGLTVDARIESFPLQLALAVARRSATARTGKPAPAATTRLEEVQGVLSGTVTARPEADQPDAPTVWTAALNVPSLSIPGYRIPPETGPATPGASQPLSVGLEARASYSTAGRLALERLAISRNEGVLLARGAVVRPGGHGPGGDILKDGQIALRVDASEIPMGLFGPLSPAVTPLRGVGELHLDANGPLNAPTIQGSVDVDRLALAGVPFTHFAIPHVVVASDRIQVENVRLEEDDKDHPSGQHYLLVDGTLPFRWKVNDQGTVVGGQVPPDRPLALTVRLPEQSLDVVNTLSHLDPLSLNARVRPVVAALGSLSAVSGTMAADLRLGGTRTQLDTSGSFQIINAALQPQRGETRFEQIVVRIGFTGNRIELQQLKGRSSNGGTFTGSGDISGIALGVGDQVPAARLNLSLAVNDVRYTERNLTGYLRERFRGTLRTVDPGHPEQRAPLTLVGDWRAPVLRGAVQVQSARLELPASLPEAQARPPFVPLNPRFHLDLLLGKDTWLVNPRLRMELAGRLPIRGTLAEPSVHATLRVQRGDMVFPTARFRMEGEVEIAYAPGAGEGGALPGGTTAVPLRVDLIATTRLRGTDPNTRQRQRYDITLVIRGPLTAEAFEGLGARGPGAAGEIGLPSRPSAQRLTIEARSDPPLPQQQILALVARESALQDIMRGGTTAQNVLRSEFEDILTASVAPTLFTPLETRIEDWLGLEEFSIDFAFREPSQVRLTRQIYGPFYATYTRSLNFAGLNTVNPNTTNPTTSLNLYTIELYYRLSDRVRLGYRIEEPSRNRVFLLNGTLRF